MVPQIWHRCLATFSQGLQNGRRLSLLLYILGFEKGSFFVSTAELKGAQVLAAGLLNMQIKVFAADAGRHGNPLFF